MWRVLPDQEEGLGRELILCAEAGMTAHVFLGFPEQPGEFEDGFSW